MKLKKQFLSLSALLGLSMAATTTAWGAAEVAANPPSKLVCDENGDNCFVNMPTPSSSAEVVLGSVTIPSNVKTFKVYDDGGADQPFTSFSGTGAPYGVRLLLTAPAGCALKISGKLYGASTGQEPYVVVINGSVYSSALADWITYGYPNNKNGYAFSINPTKTLSTGPSVIVELHRNTDHAGDNGDGLAMIVEVIPGTLVIDPSENGSYNVSSAAGQFDLQIPAGSVNNTTTLTAPEGYVLYVEGGIAVPNGGSVTAYDGANTSASQISATTGAANTESALSTSNNVTIQVATTGTGFAEAQTVTVHVLKKTTSTTAVDIYTQDDNSYAVAKITDGEYENSGAVSIPSAINVNAIIYNRTFAANTKETIVLPFSLPSGATTNAKFYYLQKVVQKQNACAWLATLKRVATPKANKPYAIIIPDATELTFDLNGGQAIFQTAQSAEQTDETGLWIFKGTYEYKVWGADDPELGLAYALAKEGGSNYVAGQFVKIGAGSTAAPMRAYMRKINADVKLSPIGAGRPLAMGEVSSIENMPETIDVELVDEDEQTTAIGRMNTVTGAIKIDRWFDLKGRSTNHKPTTKGAFFNKKGIAK